MLKYCDVPMRANCSDIEKIKRLIELLTAKCPPNFPLNNVPQTHEMCFINVEAANFLYRRILFISLQFQFFMVLYK